MTNENKIPDLLEHHRTSAPKGFLERVMNALPDQQIAAHRAWWPSHGRWIVPALAGAAATLLILFAAGRFNPANTSMKVAFHFELHAPGADRVELLGTFNNWKTGDIVLDGPDASGHWTATVELPEGRHEYIFLVDGDRWVTDPKGATHRPDGFGKVNTVIRIYENDNV